MTQIKYAVLNSTLRGFEEADTTTAVEGRIPAGKYRVLEHLANHPNEDTDYAQIELPSFGDGETWVCTRWKSNHYVSILVEELPDPEPLDFSADPMAISEDSLVSILPSFYEFKYDLDRARYPFSLDGCKVPLAPPYTNNCCTFVEALVAKAWENEKGLAWDRRKHAQMMIFSSDDFFSPVTCLIESGIGVELADVDALPAPWSVVQGWRHQWRGGHTFIIVAHHKGTDRVLTLESNSAYLLDGVGYRMIGNLRDFSEPRENWWEEESLWTWERIKSVYRYRKLCRLKLTNLSWSKT